MTLRILQSFSMNHFQFTGNPNSTYLASSHRRTMTELSLFLCGFIFFFLRWIHAILSTSGNDLSFLYLPFLIYLPGMLSFFKKSTVGIKDEGSVFGELEVFPSFSSFLPFSLSSQSYHRMFLDVSGCCVCPLSLVCGFSGISIKLFEPRSFPHWLCIERSPLNDYLDLVGTSWCMFLKFTCTYIIAAFGRYHKHIWKFGCQTFGPWSIEASKYVSCTSLALVFVDHKYLGSWTFARILLRLK